MKFGSNISTVAQEPSRGVMSFVGDDGAEQPGSIENPRKKTKRSLTVIGEKSRDDGK